MTRADYKKFYPVQTRWNDNDIYGHVNNVVYYAYFDAVINRYLVAEGGLELSTTATGPIGLCVESHCTYVAPASYPDELEAGIRVGKLGKSSVRYEIGVFRAASELCAHGYFVHVFVDRVTRRPVPIEGQLREALERLT